MKRISSIIFYLLFVFPCLVSAEEISIEKLNKIDPGFEIVTVDKPIKEELFAWNVSMHGAPMGVGAGGSPTCPAGTYVLYWSRYDTGNLTRACTNNGAGTLDGTQSGGTLTSASFTTTDRDQYISWATTIDEDGPITIFIEINADSGNTGTGYVFEHYYDADNREAMYLDASGLVMKAIRYGGSAIDNVTSGGVAYSLSSTITIGLTLEVGRGTQDWEITVDKGSAWNGDGVDGIAAMATDPTTIVIGEQNFGGTAGEGHIFTRLAVVTGWEATCPW